MWEVCLANWPAGTKSQSNVPVPDSKFTEFPAKHVVGSHIGAKDHSNSRFFSILLDRGRDHTRMTAN